jgi:hypothetical protein
MTKTELLRDHFRTEGSITSEDGARLYGIDGMSTYISKLKKEGLPVRKKKEINGEGATVYRWYTEGVQTAPDTNKIFYAEFASLIIGRYGVDGASAMVDALTEAVCKQEN